jgi:hypothetical protein
MAAPRAGFRYSLRALILLVTVLCCCGGVCHRVTLRYDARGVSSADANRLLSKTMCPVRLPAAAQLVNLNAQFFLCHIGFDLDEPEFLRWADEWGWKLKRIGPSDGLDNFTLPVPTYDDVPESITDGYAHFGCTHRGGYDVLYDRKQQRAWLLYAHH